MKKVINLLLSLCCVLLCCSCSNNNEASVRKTEKIYDYVLDAGTYTELDYEFAEKYFEEHYGNEGGGCTAMAKVNSNGEMLVGRNMDLNISNKSAYVFRTDVEGCYKTVNLMYTFRDYAPEYEDALANGLSGEFEKIMPFLADDVLNEKGLYVEVNMRNAEFWPSGESMFTCTSTNTESDERVYMFTLSRFIGEHCATVDEAIEYVKTLNIYSQDNYWNYCFLIADQSGHYGVLEFADNEIYWNDYAPAQANFYVNDYISQYQTIKTGLGRYAKVIEQRDSVETEEDMFNVMDSVSYFQVYDIDTCKFDWRSENIGAMKFATYDFVMDDANKEYIEDLMHQKSDYVLSKTRQELRDENQFWESAFTEVINCNNRTLKVRFYEDDNLTYTLSFE